MLFNVCLLYVKGYFLRSTCNDRDVKEDWQVGDRNIGRNNEILGIFYIRLYITSGYEYSAKYFDTQKTLA